MLDVWLKIGRGRGRYRDLLMVQVSLSMLEEGKVGGVEIIVSMCWL